MDDKDFNLEDIIAEFKYDEAITKTPKTAESTIDVDITDAAVAAGELLNQKLEDIRRTVEDDTEPLPTPEDIIPLISPIEPKNVPQPPAEPIDPIGEIVIDQSLFGPPEDFSQAFTPSDEYMGDNEYDDEENIPDEPRMSLRERIIERSKRFKEPEADVTPAEAAVALIPLVRSLTFRAFGAFLFCLPLIYGTLAHRFSLPFPTSIDFLYHAYMYLLFMLVGQILVMLLGADILAKGVIDFFRLRPSVETGVAVSCIASMSHVFSIFIFPQKWETYLPYCAVSAVLVFFSLLSARLRCGARLRTYMVAKNANPCQVVTMEDRLFDDSSGITKRTAAPDGFVTQTEGSDNIERFFNFFIPLALISGVLMALLITFGADKPTNFFWVWSAIMSAATPFAAMISFALPFNSITARLATVGAALAGWNGARQIAKSDVAVMTDTDVYPPGSVSLNGLKVFGTHSFDKVISYATSVVSASGSELARTFSELLKGNRDAIRTVHDFKHYEGGGMGAYLNNDRVLVGSYNFMVSMSISMPQELNIKNAVFISINMELAGIFAINYTTQENVKTSLEMLVRNGCLPLFAVRDFNITASSLKSRFKLEDDQIDYPVIEERLTLSDPERTVRAKPSAIAGREGLMAYAEIITGSFSLKRTANINLYLSIASAVVGLLLMFAFTSIGAASTASPANVLLFQLLWTAPVFLVSAWSSRY
ncbi:MAG: hypothetical protein FWG36_09445 [Oscillospiraceae bacterium]|nr:hypothetical protein [Oscillospiraceae bacterium]